jgi:hypothetical protein
MYQREQTTLDGKTHKVAFFKDRNGIEKTVDEIRTFAENTFEGMSRQELIDILIGELSIYDLIDYAQDENQVWYDE